MRARALWWAAGALSCLLMLCSCAAVPPARRDPRDPFQRINRPIYNFNNALDHAVLRPVARTYEKLPRPVRTGVSNFMSNLTYPTTIVNDFLQANFSAGTNDVARFVVNSILGLGGLFDPATAMNLDRNDEDFGLTLGKWGVPSGPFIELPFLGPSDVRDALARVPDEYMTPRAYITDPYVRWGLFVIDEINARALLLPQDRLIDSAYDPYAFVRNAYLERRYFLVHGRPEPPPGGALPGTGDALPDAPPDPAPASSLGAPPASPGAVPAAASAAASPAATSSH